MLKQIKYHRLFFIILILLVLSSLTNYSELKITNVFFTTFHKEALQWNNDLEINGYKDSKMPTLGYIKSLKQPKFLYVIDHNDMTSSERTMVATLQGLITNFSDIQIYTITKSHPDYLIWLEDLKYRYGVDYEIITDSWKLLEYFKNYIDGYVIYDNKSGNDPSINNACSLASIKRCIAIDVSMEYKVRSLGIVNNMGDCRNTDSHWAYDNLWNYGLNHSIVIQLLPNKDIALRDYAIMSKALVFYEDSKEEVILRDKVFGSMDQDSLCLGWGPDEYINISTASKHGINVVAADWSYNLSVLSSFPSPSITKDTFTEPITEENVHYVTFVMSDGDNQQWYLGSNYSSTKWYGYPNRGKFNMGWSISPSMYYLTPTVFDLYYKSAKEGETSDYFLVSPSGKGYMFPSKFPEKELDNNIKELNYYMGKVNQKYIAILDDWALFQKNVWAKYTDKENIEGIFYLNYNRQDDYKGLILWSNDKPIVSCRDLLWADIEEEDTLIEKINARVNSDQINIYEEAAYTFVYVHAWSKDMSSVEKVIAGLEKNPKIRVVTPETFMMQIKKNIKIN